MSRTEEQPTTIDRMREMWENRDPAFLGVVALLVIGLCAICLFASLLGRQWLGSDTAEPTPITAISTPLPVSATPETKVIGEIAGTRALSLTLDSPVTLSITNNSFPVTAQYIPPTGEWTSAVQGDAVWVYGTIINYVFGLPGTLENELLLEGLVQGDSIVITTQNQKQYEFIFTGREITAAADAELFSQHRPGVTLVWLGQKEASQRLVVHGEFVVDEIASSSQADEQIVELGETAQIGNIRITVLGATHVVDRPEAPPGFSLYLVDYRIENIGAEPLDTGLLRMVLVDDIGNQYSLNSLASQLGNNPLLTGFINPATSAQVTAGYQIPSNLSSATLRWVVSRVDNPGQFEVVIPFAGDAGRSALIVLQQATVSADGASLTLVGQITNGGQQPLIVNETDVSMSSTDNNTLYLVFATTPRFPWTVSPGQTIQYAVTFQRPNTETAVFSVLNQSFQLNGLR